MKLRRIVQIGVINQNPAANFAQLALSLLTENRNQNINEVEYQSGFNFRSTFNRRFRSYYSMSPSEYKVISKEKKIGK